MKAGLCGFIIFIVSTCHCNTPNNFVHSKLTPCLSNLFPHFNQHWEHYLLYYFYTNRLTIPPINFLPSQETLPRHINIQQNVKLNRAVYRYSNTCNVIFSPFNFFVNDAISAFNDFVDPSRTLFIYISDATTAVRNYNKLNWKLLFVFPALKILVGVDSFCSQKDTITRYICNGYCSSKPVPFLTFYEQLVQSADGNLLKLHQSLFRIGNQEKRIPIIVEDEFAALNFTI